MAGTAPEKEAAHSTSAVWAVSVADHPAVAASAAVVVLVAVSVECPAAVVPAAAGRSLKLDIENKSGRRIT